MTLPAEVALLVRSVPLDVLVKDVAQSLATWATVGAFHVKGETLATLIGASGLITSGGCFSPTQTGRVTSLLQEGTPVVKMAAQCLLLCNEALRGGSSVTGGALLDHLVRVSQALYLAGLVDHLQDLALACRSENTLNLA